MSSIQRSNKSSSRSKRRNRNKKTEQGGQEIRMERVQQNRVEEGVFVFKASKDKITRTMMGVEALILSIIQKLDDRKAKWPITFQHAKGSRRIELPISFGTTRGVRARDFPVTLEHIGAEMEAAIDDLRIILDFLRENKLEEERRPYYLIGDLVEMVDDALQLNEHQNRYTFYEGISSVQIWPREVKRRMLQPLGANDVGEGEGEGDGDEDYVVGLEENVKMLLHSTFKEGKCLSLEFITGMLGIGKTTLARQIYDREDVVDWFKPRAWVRVSTELTHKEILMKLIQQVVDSDEFQRDSSEKMENADNATLQHMLHQRLKGMRYFIVLDDWPKEMRFQSILKALPHEDEGSRLLLTSRSKSIRATIHSATRIRPLNSDSSWKLFLKTISSRGGNCDGEEFPEELEKEGREMLTKCGGVPFAIKEVGKQLAEKRRLGFEWKELVKSSVDLNSTLDMLEMSYQRLAPEVKPGFLYLASLKEKATFRGEKLARIWAAAEMISEFETMLRVINLATQSMLVQKDGASSRTVKYFEANVVLHRLSMRKAEEEIGFEFLPNNGSTRRPSQIDPRHRVINCSRDTFSHSMQQDNNHLIVSLFFHGGGYLDANWKSFEALKILDLEDFGLKILPESIGFLVELRYLGLRNNYILQLPESLRRLKKLEVLDIALNFMMEVPDIIWEMGSLRHLDMAGVICKKPLNLDALQNLLTLYISIDNLTPELLGLQKTRLYKLSIQELDGSSDVSKLFASLADLTLRHLILRGFRFRSMPCLDGLHILQSLTTLKLEGRLVKLPCAENFPPIVRCLTLVDSCLDEDPMPVLEKLSKLTILNLRNAYTGQEMVISSYGFPMLETLCIEKMWNLRNIIIGEGGMPKLDELEIDHCPYVETLPEEIKSMGSLQELIMVTTKKIATKILSSSVISKIYAVTIIVIEHHYRTH